MAAGNRCKSEDRGVWLIGGTLTAITGSKLPSNRQVLARFFHLHLNEKQTLQESATATTKELLQFWAKARIPTHQEYNIIPKVKDLHCKWQALKKNASRQTETQKSKEKTFSETLDDLFDVAHADALSLIKIDEDKKFLEAQREKGRRGCMGQVDAKLSKQEELRHQRESLQEQRKQKEEQRKRDSEAVGTISESSESEDGSSSADSESSVPSLPTHGRHAKKRSRLVNLFTPELASALDRTKVSDRNATYILAAAAKSLGHDPCELTLNKESTRQSRRRYRESIAAEIRKTFSPDTPLTVHWDGKLLPSLTGNENVDRLAVIVSGDGVMKLLAVPQLSSGSGEEQAAAVYSVLQDWDLTDQVRFMSFDTTSSNSGNKAGACVLLEQKMNKQLLSLACRHHIHELIVAKVFEMVIETSSGPQIKLFQRFATAWSTINTAEFESGIGDEQLVDDLVSIKEEMLAFLKNQLQTYQPRDDYRELLQLGILFLGDTSVSVKVHAPGAYHRARWMAKLVYCLKIYLFRSQFHLTDRQLSGLRQLNHFVISIYLKAWFTCPSAVSAPRQDLELLKNLVEYKKTNETVASAALKSFLRHLWYLSETLVGLAFFDDEVPLNIKVLMTAALTREGEGEPSKRIQIEDTDISSMQLSDFVTANTRQLFVALDIQQDFLRQHPSEWKSVDDYRCGQRRAYMLKVVNDAAEHGISLMQSFNAVLTKQEEQKQFLLQVVEKHRRDYPDTKKSTLAGCTSNE